MDETNFTEVLQKMQRDMGKAEALKDEDDEIFDMARSKIRSLKLKTQVVETEEAIQDMHADHLLEADKQREEITILHQRADDYMDQLDLEGNKTIVEPNYTVTDMYKNCQLVIPLQEVEELADFIAPDVEAVRQILDELLAQQAGRRRREFLDDEMRQIASVNNNSDLVDIVLPLHDLNWSDLLHNNSVWEQLNNSDAQVKHLQLRIEETDADRADALASDDMLLSEQLHDQVIALLEEFLEIIKDRIKICKTKGKRPDLLAKLEKFKQASYDTIDRLRNAQQSVKDRLNEDLDKLDQWENAYRDDQKVDVSAFEQFKDSNADAIDANEKDQNDVWDQIIGMYERLKELGDERWNLINQRIQETEKWDTKKSENNKMRLIHRDQYNTLLNLRDKCDDCMDLLKSVEDYLNKASEDIYSKSEEIEMELNNLLLDEQKNYLSVFRRYYLTCGELKYKKEKRQTAINRTVRKHDELIETAKETLDPNCRKYKEAQADALLLREEIQKKINVVSTKMDKSADDFEPTEDALNAAGISFLHPAVELQDLNSRKRRELNQVAKKYSSKDKQEIDEEDDDVVKTEVEVEQVKKSGGQGTAMRPQSPTHKRGTKRYQMERRTRDEEFRAQDLASAT
eukprot:NODE_278_length_2151_cov_113.239625_g272_i0.p1 GENE.NODE_278_length_2151_cov_113.239625_g272_i0~~NODE_278_length_2151_cov_113.239625_g272_i0.p1  ORF type:complete len:628 (-),score=204.76 NODE_278_length_2151_cov_113.239625_g272_i0:159-2042(-)